MFEIHVQRLVFVSLLALAAQGCASTAPSPSAHPVDVGGDPVVAAAAGMVGTPYRYGGTSPQGFDCSGLVYYAHRRAGISVPRTTGQQLHRARRVALENVRPGDVLFFELEGNKVSHVGIYAGADRFIHAPSTGKQVSYSSLHSPFWSSRLRGAGRFD
jgi:cell wall-associated NlpC family hydrolase